MCLDNSVNFATKFDHKKYSKILQIKKIHSLDSNIKRINHIMVIIFVEIFPDEFSLRGGKSREERVNETDSFRFPHYITGARVPGDE